MLNGERKGRHCRRGEDDVAAGAAVEDVDPAIADQYVVAGTSAQRVVSGATDQYVVAVAAIGEQLHRRPETGSCDHVVAIQAVDDEAVGGLEIGDCHRRGQPRHGDQAVVIGDRNHVVAVRRVDDDRIDRAVTTAPGQSQVDVDIADAGAGQVVDGDVVRASERPEIDRLDAVCVHRDGGNIPDEAGMGAIRRNRDVFGDIRTIELESVAAALSVDDIAAVAGVPGEYVVSVTHECGVVAGAADDEIIAVAAVDDIIAGAAVQSQADPVRLEAAGVDCVITPAGDDRYKVGRLCMVDNDLRGQPIHADRSAGSRHTDVVDAGSPSNGHGVDLPITGGAAKCPGQVNVD